jgi:hypothetical protein
MASKGAVVITGASTGIGEACALMYGQVLTQVEAPDQPTLERFFQYQYVNCEWMLRINLDAMDAAITVPTEHFAHRLALS